MTRPRLFAYPLAAVLVTAGVVIDVTLGAQAGFGWFAYAPLSEIDLSRLTAWSPARIIGTLLILAGLLVAAAVTGGLLARRRQARGGRPRGGLVVAYGIASLLAIAGVVGFLLGPGKPPISASLPLWTRAQLGAGGLMALGALIAAAALGYRQARGQLEPAADLTPTPP